MAEVTSVESSSPVLKRPSEDLVLKKQFDGELDSLVTWLEDTEQVICSSGEPTPDDPSLNDQIQIFAVSSTIGVCPLPTGNSPPPRKTKI